jgi:hypothetical protein
MIYQLKVTLEHSKPPIWRRLQVDSSITFNELHHILQIAFDWEDCHLHNFEFSQVPDRKEAQMQHDLFSFIANRRSVAYIGDPVMMEDSSIFDEAEETIAEWFIQEKAACVYTYDFGDDWRHRIVLENILEPEVDVEYPVCIKAKRLAPEEDSGGFYDDEDEEVIEMSPKEIQEVINHQFKELLNPSALKVKESHAQQIPMRDIEEIWSSLFHSAKDFKELAPWQWLCSADIFAIKDPKSGVIGYCSVMGEGQEVFGLAVYLGDSGLRSLIQVLNNQLDDPLDQHAFLLSYEDRSDITQEDYELIQDAGVPFRGRKAWPTFRSHEPGFVPWYLGDDEAELMTFFVCQAIDVCKKLHDQPELMTNSHDGQILMRTAEAEDGIIQLKDQHIDIDLGPLEIETSCFISEFELAAIKKYPLKKGALEYDVFYAPTPIQEDDDEVPYFPTMAVCLDIESGMIIDYHMEPSEEYVPSFQQHFINLIKKLEWMPSIMLVQNKKAIEVLQPLSEVLPFELEIVTELHLVNRMKQEMFAMQGY